VDVGPVKFGLAGKGIGKRANYIEAAGLVHRTEMNPLKNERTAVDTPGG
jgi:hypothetical protein